MIDMYVVRRLDDFYGDPVEDKCTNQLFENYYDACEFIREQGVVDGIYTIHKIYLK